MSVSTVLSSGNLEMICRITRRASPRHSWARGRRASSRSVGHGGCEQGGSACPLLRAPVPGWGDGGRGGEGKAHCGASGEARSLWAAGQGHRGQTTAQAVPSQNFLFLSFKRPNSCSSFKLQAWCPLLRAAHQAPFLPQAHTAAQASVQLWTCPASCHHLLSPANHPVRQVRSPSPFCRRGS